MSKDKRSSRILRINEVTKIVGLSASSIWRMEREGRFPKKIKLLKNAVGWSESEIEAWMETRKVVKLGKHRTSGRPPKKGKRELYILSTYDYEDFEPIAIFGSEEDAKEVADTMLKVHGLGKFMLGYAIAKFKGGLIEGIKYQHEVDEPRRGNRFMARKFSWDEEFDFGGLKKKADRRIISVAKALNIEVLNIGGVND